MNTRTVMKTHRLIHLFYTLDGSSIGGKNHAGTWYFQLRQSPSHRSHSITLSPSVYTNLYQKSTCLLLVNLMGHIIPRYPLHALGILQLGPKLNHTKIGWHHHTCRTHNFLYNSSMEGYILAQKKSFWGGTHITQLYFQMNRSLAV